MSQSLKRSYTEAEYLAQEEMAQDKHEYYQGAIYLMAGGTDVHAIISGNVFGLCWQALDNAPCQAFTSDMRINVESNGLHTYPDISIVCGPSEFVPGRKDTITNPVVIVEVLSPSTQRYDQGPKFELYKGIESFNDYLIVAQERVLVKHYHKETDGTWSLQQYTRLEDTVTLPQVGVTLPVQKIYRNITF